MKIIQANEINTKEKLLIELPLISLDYLDLAIFEAALYNYSHSSCLVTKKIERINKILNQLSELT